MVYFKFYVDAQNKNCTGDAPPAHQQQSTGNAMSSTTTSTTASAAGKATSTTSEAFAIARAAVRMVAEDLAEKNRLEGAVFVPDFVSSGYQADLEYELLQRHGAVRPAPGPLTSGDRAAVFWSIAPSFSFAVGTVRPLGFGRHEVRYQVRSANNRLEADLHYEFKAGEPLCVCSRATLHLSGGRGMQVTAYTGWPHIRNTVTTVHFRTLRDGSIETTDQATDTQPPNRCAK